MRIADFELERFFEKWEFGARFLLCASDVEPHSVPELLAFEGDAATKRLASLSLGYTEPAGNPELRELIAGLYEHGDPRRIFCFAGAEEAIFLTVHGLLEPGDHVIAFTPAYQSLYEIARSLGADVTLIALHEEDGWRIDPETVRQQIRPNTKMIVVNSPHNPTGALMGREEFEALLRLGEECGATVLSDEVYRFLEHREEDRLPSASDLSSNAVSIGVMSKAFGLAGLRIGWISADPGVIAKIARLKDYTTICNSAPSELFAILALRAKQQVLQRNHELVLANFEALGEFLSRHADRFSWVPPRAGATGFMRLLSGDTDEFAGRLVRETGVLVLPGLVYGYPSHFRIGFGRRDFVEGLAVLDRWLAAQ